MFVVSKRDEQAGLCILSKLPGTGERARVHVRGSAVRMIAQNMQIYSEPIQMSC